jgi:hypothetical protein
MMSNKIVRAMIAVFALPALFWLPTGITAEAQQNAAQWQLSWFAVLATPQGPLTLRAPEQVPFAAEADCNLFGRQMSPRMQDWVRGLVRADWDHDVRIAFRCEPAGVPS